MNRKQTFFFGEIPTLSSIYWSSEELKQEWKWSSRSMESVMHKFVDVNKINLNYLGIVANIETVNGKPSLKLTTSKYIGAIPINSPMNGKPAGDLIVTGRFGENIGELISLLDNYIKPEYSDKFRLVQDTLMSPPIFIECCKFIDAYILAERSHWHKFTNTIINQKEPNGSTLWREYALRTAKNPLQYADFKNKCNKLTTEHSEWWQLNHVLKIAINKLESPQTPLRTRSVYSSRIAQLKIKLQYKSSQPIDRVQIHMSDPLIIKQTKELANNILSHKTQEKIAWRMNYAEFFERYIQYLFNDIAKKKGAHEVSNPHFSINSLHGPAWRLNYLEPDFIIQKEQEQIIIDAKYKSHIFNWNDITKDLKDTFRHDLHQILAYCSLNSMTTKQAILVYPFNNFKHHEMQIKTPLNNTEAHVHLIGIPIEKSKINEIKENLNRIVSFTQHYS